MEHSQACALPAPLPGTIQTRVALAQHRSQELLRLVQTDPGLASAGSRATTGGGGGTRASAAATVPAPLAIPNYHGMKAKRLRTLLRDLGLPSTGKVEDLRSSHKAYIVQHNAMVDAGEPFSPQDVLAAVHQQQRAHASDQREARAAKALVDRAAEAFQDGAAPRGQRKRSKLQEGFLNLLRETLRRDFERYGVLHGRKKRPGRRQRKRQRSSAECPAPPAKAARPAQSSGSPAREPWIVVFSETAQRHFYFNTLTNVGQWTAPPDLPELPAVSLPPAPTATTTPAKTPTQATSKPISSTGSQGPLHAAFAAAQASADLNRTVFSGHSDDTLSTPGGGEVLLLDSQESVATTQGPVPQQPPPNMTLSFPDTARDTAQDTQRKSSEAQAQPALPESQDSPLTPQGARRGARRAAPTSPTGLPDSGWESDVAPTLPLTGTQAIPLPGTLVPSGEAASPTQLLASSSLPDTAPVPASSPVALSGGHSWSCPACTLLHEGPDAGRVACMVCGTANPEPRRSGLRRSTRRQSSIR